MARIDRPTRRQFLTAAGVASLAMPAIITACGGGSSSPSGGTAQGAPKPPKKTTSVQGFTTGADVEKAEAEGAVTIYTVVSGPASQSEVNEFHRLFPKIKPSYVRLQAGALYSRLMSERQAGQYLADVLIFTEMSEATDFQAKGGWEPYVSPAYSGFKAQYQSSPAGYFVWQSATLMGIGYSSDKLNASSAPRDWKDLLDSKWQGAISCKLADSGNQEVQWYVLREMYGDDFWKKFAKQKPKAFDSSAQLWDRLSKGEDKLESEGEYGYYQQTKAQGAPVGYVFPKSGLVANPQVVGAVSKGPHPEASKLFLDWMASQKGQTFLQTDPQHYYVSVRSDAPPLQGGKSLKDLKLLFPKSWKAYRSAHTQYTREWNSIVGLTG